MITCTKRFTFDAAHRIVGHQGLCQGLHGHTYAAEVTAATEALDDLGMVVDFGDIKAIIGQWLATHWDHALILWDRDPLVSDMEAILGDGHRTYWTPWNPTAENMAKHLLAFELPRGRIVSVKVWETPTSYAEATADE